MTAKSARFYARLLGSASAITLLSAGVALAEPADFSIAPQPLAMALNVFSEQSGRAVLLKPELATTLTSRGVDGSLEPEIALAEMLQGTGLTYRKTGDTFLIVDAQDPQSESAAGGGAEGTVDALIVTAQKREEDIQDVPIAISAFTQEDLTRSQVAGGPDLMTQVPNFTFTKTNFSSYSIQIRGIGTQAISATVDPAVAIAFNNTSFIRNRFFEQEFYDLQRVEVLRGPQGTLYGRNATAGVVNIISSKPSFGFESRLSGDIANYNSTRVEGMINVPLADDTVAVRLAGAWTKRDGYASNQITGNPIDGRDLWSTRLSLRFAPTDRFEANLIWEHFREDDDRLRSGKQLCKTHEITEVGGIPVGPYQSLINWGQGGMYPAVAFSQGCIGASLYSPESFQTPNGLSLPYYYPLSFIFLPAALTDPYVSRSQSSDLRVIESTVDPEYAAETNVVELQFSVDVNDRLSLTSETAYLSDTVFSMQDYNRFNTAPGAWLQPEEMAHWGVRDGVLTQGPLGGIFCDPQLGCSDRMVAVDVSTATSTQFSQEFRLSSDYDGRFNFSLGGNFLRYDTEDKYYVFINSLSLISAISPFGSVGRPLPPYAMGVDNAQCLANGMVYPDPKKIQEITYCTYMDPNPIGSLNDLGHNYFLSRNPYKLISYAVFGEAYYQIADNLKVTGGLRWTVDRKEAPRIPSWVLASESIGYPVVDVTRQEWREPTGRLTLDWKPDLSFTDETLLYLSVAHGYKAGGANPPPTGPVAYCSQCGTNADVSREVVSRTHPKTFEPEFIDALEVGAKSTFADGRVTLNLAAFYYDYTGYQISQIVNRSAVNLNFDAEVWGLEIEADWRPLENLRLGFKGGYENTRVADGMKAIDLMDRTAGDPDWVVVRPFPTYTSNCIMPKWLFAGVYPEEWGDLAGQPAPLAMGGVTGGNPGGCELAYVLGLDPATQLPYEADPAPVNLAAYLPDYPGWNPEWAPNNGEGFDKDLSGNELPNAPHYTATITADYTIPLPNDWLATLHSDLYYQSEAWTRIFNMEGYDKLKAYTNVNLAAIFTNEDAGWKVMAYVKNVFDRDSITGSFLNSDDTGLTTNVFLTEPRLYGLRVTKEWNGGPWWTGADLAHDGPYPLTVEVSGQAQRQQAPYAPIAPSFAEAFSDALDPAGLQKRDLDWGDERGVRISYALPTGWGVAATARFGRTNGDDRMVSAEQGGRVCLLTQTQCEAYVETYGDYVYFMPNNFTNATVTNREDYTIVDFEVSRDVGFGLLGSHVQSSLAAGVRHADFGSRTHLDFVGVPGWELPEEGAFFTQSEHIRYEADFLAEREFKGVGPAITWNAALPLLSLGEGGQIALAWSAEAGVLFGKQKTRFQGSGEAAYFEGVKYGAEVGDPLVIRAPASRSASAAVPVVGGSVGISYEVQRVRLGAGYRWERYFDVLDVGYDERREADRTIDGPYLKVAIGFGG